jgi:hypothetical protein
VESVANKTLIKKTMEDLLMKVMRSDFGAHFRMVSETPSWLDHHRETAPTTH